MKDLCGLKEWTITILSLMALGGFLFFGGVVLLGFGPAMDPKDRLTTINTIFNFTWAGVGIVLGFHFGSSKGSAEKDSTIANMSKSLPEEKPHA